MRSAVSTRLAHFFVLLVKIFCIGLLIHFLLHTRVTHGIGLHIPLVWARKELLLGVFFITICYGAVRFSWRKRTASSRRHLMLLCGCLVVGIGGSLLIHLFHLGAPLQQRIMAMRYDYLGFVLLVSGWISTFFMKDGLPEHVLRRYGRVVKRVLVFGLIRWCIVAIKPGAMKLLGYNNYVFEGTVGMQPPAVYYTHINYGLPRSQFLFERPTTFGFWLTAFFPLFYFLFLARRPVHHTRGWWAFYCVNVVLTFSRAARGSRIIVVLLCLSITSMLPWKKLLVRYGIPILLFFGGILVLGWEQIALRGYSNYGHMSMVQQGREMLVQKPIRGRGGSSAGPGSHRAGGPAFNPENQFLQILVEFGVLGALPWLFLRGWTVWIGLFSRLKQNNRIMIFSLGMVTLTTSGMVLHSFGDRMIVYPFMLLFGIALGTKQLSVVSKN